VGTALHRSRGEDIGVVRAFAHPTKLLLGGVQNPLGPNTLMPSFLSNARPKRYFISGPS